MNIIVAYKTKLGGSKIYAEWLAEALGTSARTYGEIARADLEACDAIAVISGTYAGMMPLTRFLKRNWKILENKKVAAVALGGVAPDKRWSKWSHKRIPRRIRGQIRYWKLPGKGDEKQPITWGELKRENLDEVIAYLRE